MRNILPYLLEYDIVKIWSYNKLQNSQLYNLIKITEIFDLYGQMLYAGYSNQNLQLLKWKILSNIKIKWKILRNILSFLWNKTLFTVHIY